MIMYEPLNAVINDMLVNSAVVFNYTIFISYPANTQLFITLLESCAELVWDKRCSNLVATFDQIYFVWQ